MGELVLVERKGYPALLGRGKNHHARPSQSVGRQVEEVAVFGRIRRFGEADVPSVEVRLGARFTRGHLFERDEEFRAGTHERESRVDVVEEFELRRNASRIDDLVPNVKPGRAGRGQVRNVKRKLARKEGGFVDGSRDGHSAGFGIVHRAHLAGGHVGDPSVERISENAGRGEFRGSVAVQAAAGDPFVESLEPAQTARMEDRNVARVDRSVYRRIPFQFDIAARAAPDSHPFRKENGERKETVINFQNFDSVGKPSGQAPFGEPDGDFIPGFPKCFFELKRLGPAVLRAGHVKKRNRHV